MMQSLVCKGLVLTIVATVVSCAGTLNSDRGVDSDSVDYPIGSGDVSTREIGEIVRFLETRPYADSLGRRLSENEAEDVRVVSKSISNGVARYEVSTNPRRIDTTVSLTVLHVDVVDGEFHVTWVGSRVIDAD